MGQNKRPVIGNINSKKFKGQAIKIGVDGAGRIFDVQDSMGANSFDMGQVHKRPISNFLSFFSRLGSYNVYNFLPKQKDMGALIKLTAVYLANLFGISLCVYWLTIDFEGIKVFITSVGVFLYGGMKLYEKYLDLKEKKRKQDEHNNHAAALRKKQEEAIK